MDLISIIIAVLITFVCIGIIEFIRYKKKIRDAEFKLFVDSLEGDNDTQEFKGDKPMNTKDNSIENI
jgi:hypothetical protein